VQTEETVLIKSNSCSFCTRLYRKLRHLARSVYILLPAIESSLALNDIQNKLGIAIRNAMSDKCYLKMSELSSLNLRRISIPSPTDVVLV
jgi:hypothetical protein